MPNAADKEDLADDLLAGLQLIQQNIFTIMEWPETSVDVRAHLLRIADECQEYINLAAEKTG